MSKCNLYVLELPGVNGPSEIRFQRDKDSILHTGSRCELCVKQPYECSLLANADKHLCVACRLAC
jgi:hypothetical protein